MDYNSKSIMFFLLLVKFFFFSILSFSCLVDVGSNLIVWIGWLHIRFLKCQEKTSSARLMLGLTKKTKVHLIDLRQLKR
jgi:hypothetical protein